MGTGNRDGRELGAEMWVQREDDESVYVEENMKHACRPVDVSWGGGGRSRWKIRSYNGMGGMRGQDNER